MSLENVAAGFTSSNWPIFTSVFSWYSPGWYFPEQWVEWFVWWF